ncbi:unnamed protein product [Amoebophrya sp. A25]|nr:unnamed protein product [Amoebophrya sp. A25]|eukprot:GSA25T00020237001.1
MKKKFEHLQRKTQAKNDKFLRTHAPAHLWPVLGVGATCCRNVIALEKLLKWAGHKDTNLCAEIVTGFPAVGNATQTNVWETDPNVTPITDKQLQEFFDNVSIVKRAAPRFDDAVLESMFEDAEKMADAGSYIRTTQQQLVTNPSYAFPKVEELKIRQIIDARPQNEYSTLPEKVRLHGTRMIQEMYAAYLAPLGLEATSTRLPSSHTANEAWRQAELHRNSEHPAADATPEQLAEQIRSLNQETPPASTTATLPEAVVRDWSKAYYLFGVARPEHNSIAFYAPSRGDWQYYHAAVLNMGNTLSVPNFCRISEAFMTILDKTTMPALIYIDDAFLLGPNSETAELMRQTYDALSACCGMALAEKADGNQISTATNAVKVLGVWYLYDRTNAAVYAYVSYKNLAKLLKAGNLLLQQIKSKSIKKKQVQKVLGMLNFVICHTTRIGAEFLRGMHTWTTDSFDFLKSNKQERASLARLTKAAVAHATQLPPQPLSWTAANYVFLYLDASTDGLQGEPMIGGLLLDAHGSPHTFASAAPTGDWTIEQYETMAVCLAQHHFRHQLRGATCICSIDNTGELYALIKTSARNAHTARLATWAAKRNVDLDCRMWHRYVQTARNPADPLTRMDLIHHATALWGRQAEDVRDVPPDILNLLTSATHPLPEVIIGPHEKCERIWGKDYLSTIEHGGLRNFFEQEIKYWQGLSLTPTDDENAAVHKKPQVVRDRKRHNKMTTKRKGTREKGNTPLPRHSPNRREKRHGRALMKKGVRT